MAFTHIEISTQTRASAQLRELCSTAQRTNDLVLQVMAIFDTLKDGSDFTQIEAVYGLPTGKGAVVYNMVKDMVAQIVIPAAGLTIAAGDIGGYQRYISRLG